MLDMCRITDCPVPAMISAILRRIARPRSAAIWGTETGLLTREAVDAVVAPLSNLLDQTPAPPGKREHLALIMQGQNQIHSLNAGVHRFSPLASQPLVECCLRIPSWEWVSGGINRAVARAAFAGELPRQVTTRTSKTGPDSFLRQAYAVHRARIAGQLLDGILVAEHVVDRVALEHALATDVLRDEQTFGRVLDILEVENWARSWTA
jgi:asparagine synthase (glutamine-hydrolysing)